MRTIGDNAISPSSSNQRENLRKAENRAERVAGWVRLACRFSFPGGKIASSQMNTPGPATSLRTWSWPFPQNEQRLRANHVTWTRIGEAIGLNRLTAWEHFSGED
jgi:hypothetical protein